ncbi:MAG: HlyU family transcriptional regulator [Arenicellales bacterium]
MIGDFLGRLFRGQGGTSGEKVVASETYQGFQIRAAPVGEAGGWRVAGHISKTVDGEEKTHRFVRADTCSDAESAASMTLRKAKQLIDERGDKLFD